MSSSDPDLFQLDGSSSVSTPDSRKKFPYNNDEEMEEDDSEDNADAAKGENDDGDDE